MSTLRIATRQSPLALWQAHFVKRELENRFPELQIELVTMVTRGDIILDTPLAKIGGKGLFVKELELALLEGRADLAVHSMKDVPMQFPEGLGLSAICAREEPRDAFVSNRFASLADLPEGAVVGTSSLRRQAQLAARFPHLTIRSLRGNVGTRLAKLDSGEFDAIILAAAGLIRLEQADRIRELISDELSLPACGQGAVGIETRIDDERTRNYVRALNDAQTAACVNSERAMNTHLQGGCQVPIAGFATLTDGIITLRGLVGKVDGSQLLTATASAPESDAHALGVQVAEELLAQGASAILADVYQSA